MRRFIVLAGLVACAGDVEIVGETDTTGLDASCSDGSPIDTYVAGLARASDAGSYEVVLLDASPSPPDVGINTFAMQVDGATGVVIAPWMPLHGHGTVPQTFAALEEVDGTWTTPEMDLFMPGLWEIELTLSGAAEDTALFRFCLEG